MLIKILGPGCRNCVALTENTKNALKEAGIDAEVIKVQDIKDISTYGIMSTPGLVIDEKVVSYGKVLKPKQIVEILKKQLENKQGVYILNSKEEIREFIRNNHSKVALKGSDGGCCSSGCSCSGQEINIKDTAINIGYSESDFNNVTIEAVASI